MGVAVLQPRSEIGKALASAGRTVGWCRSCGREFDAGHGYAGGRTGGLPRLACSIPCRDRLRLERRTVLRGHRSTWHDLAERHRIEDDGQLDITGLALPTVPPPPAPPSRTADVPLPLEVTR